MADADERNNKLDLMTEMADALRGLVEAARGHGYLPGAIRNGVSALARYESRPASTTNGGHFLCVVPATPYNQKTEEWGEETWPIAVAQEGGVRLMCGASDYSDHTGMDVLIERQKGRWLIFVHPEAGNDPSCYVYVTDSGKTYVQPELYADVTWTEERPDDED